MDRFVVHCGWTGLCHESSRSRRSVRSLVTATGIFAKPRPIQPGGGRRRDPESRIRQISVTESQWSGTVSAALPPGPGRGSRSSL
jgi:hypothetical protein